MSNAQATTSPFPAGPASKINSPGRLDFKPASESENDPILEGDPIVEEVPASGPTAGRPPAKKKRGLLSRLAIAVLIVAGGLWVANFIHRALVFEETDDSYITGHIHQVSSRLAGSVTEVLVNENESVKAGQVLARIDPLEFQIALQESKAALAQAEANVQQAQATLAQAEAQAAQSKAQQASSEAHVHQIQSQLDIANVNFNRDQHLYQSDMRAISKSDLDATENIVQAATAALAGANADATAAQSQANAADATVNAAKAAITTARTKVDAETASVRDAERNLSYVEIKAPSDGRIGNKNVEVGNRVQIGQALFAEVDNDCWVTANFKETQLKKMEPGQAVEITVDAIGGKVFTGKLDSIAPASGAEFALLPPDNATGNFTKVVQRVPGKILFDADSIRGFEDRLRPGLSTVVSVRIK